MVDAKLRYPKVFCNESYVSCSYGRDPQLFFVFVFGSMGGGNLF
jgi:hypothetical protein